MDTRREVEHFRLFSVFLAAGLVDMSLESLNFSNASNTEKQMLKYPKMAPRLGQHIFKAKSKAGNFGLFALYSSFSFYLLFGCPMANFWLLLSKNSHSASLSYRICGISLWPSAGMEGVGSLHRS